MTTTLKTSVVETFRDESEEVREILRRGYIRNLPAGQHASLAKIIEAAQKGVELRTGETFVNPCTVRIKCA
ncbi:MAG: hypothetical protein GX660_17900 [Clostridiaceae bacterium]|nr:hypothetical protein [Clostridiaceae bacterium]